MGKLCVGRMVLGSIGTNCYIIYDEDDKKCIIVDPAKNGIYDKLRDNGLEPVAVILTHGHFDHIMGCHELQSKSLKICALDLEKDVLRDSELNASDQIGRPYTVEADRFFTDGEEVTIEGMTFKVISTPGHTKGSCCYYFEKDGIMISGDTLFQCSVGRSDLPTGNESEIMLSVKRLTQDYPEDVKVYPGHGDSTTIGYEKKYNPFCRG